MYERHGSEQQTLVQTGLFSRWEQCIFMMAPQVEWSVKPEAEERMERLGPEIVSGSHLQSPVLEATKVDGCRELPVEFPCSAGLGWYPLG